MKGDGSILNIYFFMNFPMGATIYKTFIETAICHKKSDQEMYAYMNGFCCNFLIGINILLFYI